MHEDGVYTLCVCVLVFHSPGGHARAVPKIHSVAAATIGQRIRSARLELGITLEDLAELSVVNAATIGKIERGVSSPSVESVVRIATALEVDPGALISELTADDYGDRVHRFTARDFLRARERRA